MAVKKDDKKDYMEGEFAVDFHPHLIFTDSN
jgi:hypothetical protein